VHHRRQLLLSDLLTAQAAMICDGLDVSSVYVCSCMILTWIHAAVAMPARGLVCGADMISTKSTGSDGPPDELPIEPSATHSTLLAFLPSPA
jgi:hypothetical protein